eukprot:6196544-Pleurochrysis_carterae.AAC.3
MQRVPARRAGAHCMRSRESARRSQGTRSAGWAGLRTGCLGKGSRCRTRCAKQDVHRYALPLPRASFLLPTPVSHETNSLATIVGHMGHCLASLLYPSY